MSARPVRGARSHSVLAAGLGLVVAVGLGACGTHAPSQATSEPSLGYRSLPTYLPTASTSVDRVVTASSGHPRLAVQGVGVRVDLPHGHALATVTGPKVPPFTAPPPPEVTATFTVELTHVSGVVPVRAADFTITDQLGRTFRPSLPVGQAAPPTSISRGGTASFRLTAVMPTGEGRIYWGPTGGAPIVGWDFIVEND